MTKQIIREGDEGVELIVDVPDSELKPEASTPRFPVHVVYGGADRFNAGTPRKLGDLALRSMENYAANFVEFATALGLKDADELSPFPDEAARLGQAISGSPDDARRNNFPAWLA